MTKQATEIILTEKLFTLIAPYLEPLQSVDGRSFSYYFNGVPVRIIK